MITLSNRTTMGGAPPLLDRELPAFVRDLLGSAPKVGEGVDSWLFRTARVLHPFRREPEIVTLLEAATHGERIRAGAIERAVRNSKAAAWNPSEPVARAARTTAWPPLDTTRRDKIVADGPDAATLCELAPVTFEVDDGSNAAEIVEQLFSTVAVPDPLLCVGRNNAKFATRKLSTLLTVDKLPELALIVPSPMSATVGKTKEGHESEHCLDNTGRRRFLVVEFDKGATDEHAALLWHLAAYGPLAMVVHSGGKSLHGWFFCAGQSEANMRRFMEYAVSLGADDATWTRSQFVRLPAGRRENGARQQVFYFDPATVQRGEEKL